MLNRLMSILTIAVSAAPVWAGPYSGPLADPTNSYDPGVAGWVGPAGEGLADVPASPQNPMGYPHPGNYVNPAFVGWANGWLNYRPAVVDPSWTDPTYALGAATGDEFHVVSLGDLTAAQIAAHLADPGNPNILHPGQITLTFARPIFNGPGADFAVFENGFSSGQTTFFAELAYVEVSTNGVDFARFPSRSLTPNPGAGGHAYLAVNSTDVYNLAGKHANAHGKSWGTPFNLDSLASDLLVQQGTVDLLDIRYVRVVDIPGSGDFLDGTGTPIFDGWVTTGSAGFDLDAVGALHDKLPGDADLDEDVDILDLGALANSYGMKTGAVWAMGDFDGNGAVDILDLGYLAGNYGIHRPVAAVGAAGVGAPAAVPEPASWLMLSAAGAWALRRRRR